MNWVPEQWKIIRNAKNLPNKMKKSLVKLPYLFMCTRNPARGYWSRYPIHHLCIWSKYHIESCMRKRYRNIHLNNNITRVGVNWYYNPRDFSTCPVQVCRIVEQCIKQTLDKNNKNSCNNIWSIPFQHSLKNFFFTIRKKN